MKKLAIVFFFTGLWHGANWTFVLWGLYHGFFLLLEECVPVLQKLPKWLGNVYTVLVVCIGFVMFRADTVSQGVSMIRQMFTGLHFSEASVSLLWQQLTPWFLVMFFIALSGACWMRPVSERIRSVLLKPDGERAFAGRMLDVMLYVGSVVLLLWCMVRLSAGTYNPFIYFRF